jgi:hypothetical protein
MVDAAMGGALALGLITAAEAALPRVQRLAVLPSPRPAPVAPWRPQPPQPPAAPPALIAFQEPLPGYPIISPFGLRQLPWEGGGRLHAGVDIAAPPGQPVRASADGVVTRATSDAGYGRFVELKHAAGLVTRYAHLARFAPQIAPGVAVKAGETVGETGSTGSSTGAHLHFEVRDDQDRPLNPELFLGRQFAESKDLPLKAAQRFPRGVHVAYVSRIPKVVQKEIQAKLDAQMQLAAAEAASYAGSDAAASATGSAANASAIVAERRHGRPHARFVARK